jgi:hypothetical protein
MAALVDLSGQRFGRLTVQRRHGSSCSHATWLCICDCGAQAITTTTHLKKGHTSSCGCVAVAARRKTGLSRATHGHTRQHIVSPEYRTWSGMHTRCSNQSDKNFARYGARGITVCDRWSAFEAFLADMGPRPSLSHSIERNDNDGNYEPGNCRWATKKEQSRNQRSAHLLTVDGRTQCVAAWAEELGIKSDTVRKRLGRGYALADALSPTHFPKRPGRSTAA